MSDELDALLERVEDPGVLAELRDQIDRLRRKRQFGLVFEAHLPERVRLLNHPIRRGASVVRRDTPGDPAPLSVVRTNGETAVLDQDGETVQLDCDELVVVAEFGEPVYPGLRRVGSLDRGGDRPAHTVINGENYHALEALRFSHAGKVDCIYIDPPYNSGARDWKYNNDYVDENDAYRHSKWLAFMERRLLLARELLNPDTSVLIVAIDEKEYLRLGLLLEQTFPSSEIQMVSTVVKPGGTSRTKGFSRVDEYLFFVFVGAAEVHRTGDNMLSNASETNGRTALSESSIWEGMVRRGIGVVRRDRPKQFYPIFIDADAGRIMGSGAPLGVGQDRNTVEPPPELAAVWPIKDDGTEGFWQLSPAGLEKARVQGTVRVGSFNAKTGQWRIQYMKAKKAKAVLDGTVATVGKDENGVVILDLSSSALPSESTPRTVWNRPSHDASVGGAGLLNRIVPGRKFPFPKSLYAVEDCLRFAVQGKPDACVVDYFAGSGTTAHAVFRLNRQDGGRRQSISITNNEVSIDEAQSLRKAGFQPGDPEWEKLGIFEHITRPRIVAAVTGVTPGGEPLEGEYKFSDEFSLAEGFDENVEFLEMTYLDVEDVELDLAFESVASFLWLRAGGKGPVIGDRRDGSGQAKPYDMTDQYGVLFDPDRWRAFIEGLSASVTTVFVVTDSSSVFAGVAAELPSDVEVVRLYENYLTTFAINRGR